MDFIKITEEPLHIEVIMKTVGCTKCGAISTFTGTTRDTFNKKCVIHLEYEAYIPMAEQEMTKICKEIRGQWDVEHIALYHRLGKVPIGEASVIIAISSVHRKESLQAVEYAINTLKAKVPVWKKEMYSDGTCNWKENKECCWSKS